MKIETANSGWDACPNQHRLKTTALSPIFHNQQKNFIKKFLNDPGDYRKTFNKHNNKR